MENQDQEPQKKGRCFASLSTKKKILIVSLFVLLLIGFVSCRSAGHTRRLDRNHFMRTGYIALAAKDFEPMGVVFAETAAVTREGYAITYNTLVKEAAQKGADAIINVSISPAGMLFGKTWSGSALAIKYLEPVSGESGSAALQTPCGRGFGRRRF